ncbi:phospholipase DDHD1 isoform X2, partial [Sigmodon hispidus]
MNYPGRSAPRSSERNGRGGGGGAWELGSDAVSTFGGGCCFEHQPGDGVPLALLRAEPLHLAPGTDDLSNLALDSCLSDENYDFSSAESGSSLRCYSKGESAGGSSSSSPPPPLVAPNSGGGGAAGGAPGTGSESGPAAPLPGTAT